jgi:glyoxylase-like metal-dependent hydrolase (beta-lactamase superfamily II)
VGSIEALAIPTPWAVGDVNCFLVDDDPLTLVDTGPDTPAARAAIDAALAEHGRKVEDLGRIVLTHQHLDHAGLAAWLRDRSGAEVLCLDALAPLMARYRDAMEEDDLFAVDMMLKHGISRETTAALRVETKASHMLGLDLEGAIGVADGDAIEFEHQSWTAHHRPGHSPSDMVFVVAGTEKMIGGDHLLSKISSNPIVHLPLDGSRERPRSLVTYIESLKTTQAMEISVVHGGHGEPVTEHASLIDERLRQFDRRAGKIERVLSDGPLTAHGIALELWGDIAVKRAYLTLSEVLGHLDLLIADGRAVEIPGDIVKYTLP